MKVNDKVYCIKNYICDTEIINTLNKEYCIIRTSIFQNNENDKIISIDTNKGTINIFWLTYQEFNDGWDNMRKNNLFNDYFITERKYKLRKINEKVLENTK